MDRTKTIAACLIMLLCAACSRGPRIIVGSKNFTEQVLLGEILAQHIENRMGVTVEHDLNLGGTLLAHEALVKGSIDLYPEYTGTALTAILKQQPVHDSAAALAAVRAAYQSRWGLTWLDPLGFENTFAMIIPGGMARGQSITTLSHAAAARAWHLGAGYEFQQRPDGLQGLLKTYGLRTASNPVTMDLGLLYSALDNGKVNMIAASSTDGQISGRDVVILKDDKNYFPPYDCAVVVRDATLARFPALRDVLQQLSGSMGADTMRRLNHEVDVERRPVKQVAAEFLKGVDGRERY